MDSSIVVPEFIDARVGPRGSLENLSQAEIGKLLDSGQGGLYRLFRQCALAVLNSGAGTDNAKEIFDRYRDFDIEIVRHAWGIKLEMHNAPAAAFVDGQMIRGIKEHLFAVLRDVVFISNEIIDSGRFDLHDSAAITNAVFHVVRKRGCSTSRRAPTSSYAGVATPSAPPNTSTRRMSAMSWACALSTSAPAAVPVR